MRGYLRANRLSPPAVDICMQAQVFICPQLQSMFCVVYQLCRVRGAKAVVRLMPHEAAELEPVIHALQAQVKPAPFCFVACCVCVVVFCVRVCLCRSYVGLQQRRFLSC